MVKEQEVGIKQQKQQRTFPAPDVPVAKLMLGHTGLESLGQLENYLLSQLMYFRQAAILQM